MNVLDIEETKKILGITLPQLAELCRQEKITPLYHFIGVIATDYNPVELEVLNGYITSIAMQRLIATPHTVKEIQLETALKIGDLNDRLTWSEIYLAVSPNSGGHFTNEYRTPYDYECNGFIYHKYGVTVTLEDLRFNREQVESLAPKAMPADNDEMKGNEKTAVTKLIYALMLEAKIPIDGKRKGATNEQLVNLTKSHKVEVARETIANWLDRTKALQSDLQK